MRPSSWNGVGAIAKVPAALAVSFVISCLHPSSVIPGWPEGQGPEPITPACGCGFRARDFVAPRNDISFKPPRRLLDLLLGEEDLLGVGDDVLRLPPCEWRRPAFHFHHPHFAHAARAGDTEHFAGLIAG